MTRDGSASVPHLSIHIRVYKSSWNSYMDKVTKIYTLPDSISPTAHILSLNTKSRRWFRANMTARLISPSSQNLKKHVGTCTHTSGCQTWYTSTARHSFPGHFLKAFAQPHAVLLSLMDPLLSLQMMSLMPFLSSDLKQSLFKSTF